MCGLLPRSLPSPIPHNPYQSSGSSWSLASGDLRRLSPGRLCCSSKEISGQIWFCCGKFAGDCVPLGSGAGDPIGTGVSSTASPGGPRPPPPPPWTVSAIAPAAFWRLPPPSRAPTWPSLVSPPAQPVPPQKGCRSLGFLTARFGPIYDLDLRMDQPPCRLLF